MDFSKSLVFDDINDIEEKDKVLYIENNRIIILTVISIYFYTNICRCENDIDTLFCYKEDLKLLR